MLQIKKLVFTLITLILIPLLFFVFIELSLKVFGVGTSYDYFNEIEIEGETFFQDNPNFADQFYPASLNIAPLENTFSEVRDENLVRVYVLGGSAAMGFPHKNHGIDRLLGAQLRAALPDKKIEIINLAMTSVNSHVVYEVARSIPDNSADFAIVLMGNNEVVGPYGPGTFNQNFLSNITLIRGMQAIKRTRLWQALSDLAVSVNPTDAVEELEWEGMQMFTEHGVPESDPRMASVYSHYENNLRDIIDILQDKNIHVVLSSVPVNTRNSAPFLSMHNAQLSAEQKAQWQTYYDNGSASIKVSDWQKAVNDFTAAIKIDPDYADSHFQLATAFENLKQYDKAKEHYIRALNLDALRFRADSQISKIIEQVASSLDDNKAEYVDGAKAFELVSRPYQPGWNLLLEHVHYDYSGNYLLATEFARAIVAQVDVKNKQPLLPKSEVAKRVGFPNSETTQLMNRLLSMVKKPPFTGQSNHDALVDFVSNKVSSVKAEVGSPEDTIARRQSVVSAGLADWKLHFELAVLNQFTFHNDAAMAHFDAIFKLYPHNRESYVKIAEMLSRQGKWQEVIPYLERSMYYVRGNQDKIAETKGWLGTAYLRIKEFDKGVEILEGMIEDYPEHIELTLRSYGNLIKYARDEGLNRDAERYINGVQNYANALIKAGRDKEFPLLYRRMAQIMTLAGNKLEANKWQEKGTKKP